MLKFRLQLAIQIISFCCWFSYANGAIRIISLSGGEVKGRLVVTASGSKSWAFQGVPYAEPPVGPLRFAKPIPKKPWKDVLSCHEYKPACWQNVTGTGVGGETEETVISEDCLYANVFVGENCLNELGRQNNDFRHLCPVIYYIHGGGYEFDSPRMFKPEILVQNYTSKNLVYVTLAYRLNVFGFWSTGMDDALGNWALHDMIRGAEWIRKEISHFGGDPNRVTVQGHSSSAMAISLLSMSPNTDGLFHQAILMSGTSCKREGALSTSLNDYGEIAVILGCCTWPEWTNRKRFSKKILDCMRKVDVSILGNAFQRMRGDATASGNSKRMTLPRIDGPNGLFAFTLPQLIAKRRPITALMGTVKNEVGYKKFLYLNATTRTINETCKDIIDKEDWKRKTSVIDRCAQFYVQNNTAIDSDSYKYDPVGNHSFPFWTERVATLLEDDDYFAPCHLEASSLVAKGAQVYLYSFDYEKIGLEHISPFHAFDMAFVNGLHVDDYKFDERDRQVQWRYVDLLVNFVLYSNPTPRSVDNVTWRPLSNPWSFDYLSVDVRLKSKMNYHEQSVLFWNYELPHLDDNVPLITGKSLVPENTRFTTTMSSKITWDFVAMILGVILTLFVVLIVFFRHHYKRKTKSCEKITLLTREYTASFSYESLA